MATGHARHGANPALQAVSDIGIYGQYQYSRPHIHSGTLPAPPDIIFDRTIIAEHRSNDAA